MLICIISELITFFLFSNAIKAEEIEDVAIFIVLTVIKMNLRLNLKNYMEMYININSLIFIVYYQIFLFDFRDLY